MLVVVHVGLAIMGRILCIVHVMIVTLFVWLVKNEFIFAQLYAREKKKDKKKMLYNSIDLLTH